MTDDGLMIRTLHRSDEWAARRGDYRTLRSLISDEAVILPPRSERLHGKEALDAAFIQPHPACGEEVLSYTVLMEEVIISSPIAIEYGRIFGTTRSRDNGREVRWAYHVMRVLRKEHGDWKIYRSIWNEAPVPAEK